MTQFSVGEGEEVSSEQGEHPPKKRQKKKEPEEAAICADSLFPIIVWVTIHANLPDINMLIGHLERFVKDDIKFFGEVGISLSLIEGENVIYTCIYTLCL